MASVVLQTFDQIFEKIPKEASKEQSDKILKEVRQLIDTGLSKTELGNILFTIVKKCILWKDGAVLANIVDMLLDAGVNIDKKNTNGLNILHVSIDNGCAEVLEKLITLPESVKLLNEENNKGYTPFMRLVKVGFNRYIPIIRTILKIPGFDPDYASKKLAGITAFDVASREDIRDILLEYSHETIAPRKVVQHYAVKTNTSLRASKLRGIIERYRKPRGTVLEITSLDQMPHEFPEVESIVIHPIGLTELPNLPASVKYLNVSGNPIRLPKHILNLEYLLCAGCGIEELPSLPDTLLYLDARDNNIKDIPKLPRLLNITPMGKVNSEEDILYSSNVLLTGNPLPLGLINGFGSITQYSNQHIKNVIEYKGDTIYTMVLPKGTLLFRNVQYENNDENSDDSDENHMKINMGEIKGVYSTKTKSSHVFPEYNVFFYPYPFVADSFMESTKSLRVFELVRDIEVLMGVAPSQNTREDRFKSEYMVSCDQVPTGVEGIHGFDYDPCFSRDFSSTYKSIAGMFVLANMDTIDHIRNDMKQRFWSKYRTNFIDARNSVGVAEIILHPHADRYDPASPFNYKIIAAYPHSRYAFKKAYNEVENNLKNGKWTIDLFTKLYVNYDSVSDEVKARCVPPEEPYKLRYLNYDYWKKTGGKRKSAKTRKRKSKKTKTRRHK